MADGVDASMVQENLEEYINDENKIVTYRWLSLTLNIHVNQAKQALYTFATSQRDKGGNDDINVTYFVAGLGETKTGDPIHRCVVCPEDQLDVVKASLHPVTSCHVYSVQKLKLKDTNALYQTDYDIIKQNWTVSPSLSAISCPWAVMREGRSSQSTNNTKTSPQKSDKPAVKNEPKPSSASNSSSSTSGSAGGKTSDTNSAATAGGGKKKTEGKGSSIASMFASVGKKADGNKKTTAAAATAEKTQPSKQKAKAPDKKGGIGAFFSAQPKEKCEAASAAAPKEKEAAKPQASTKIEKDSKEKAKETSKKPAKQSRKSKRIDDSDDEMPVKKSRRRIKTDLFDSSSNEEGDSEAEREANSAAELAAELAELEQEAAEAAHNTAVLEDSDDGDDDEAEKEEAKRKEKKEEAKTLKSKKKSKEKTPEPETKMKKEEATKPKTKKASPPPSDGARKRKRVRKAVSKQYVDEDGFMVTEKVYVSDSTDASDEEEEVEESAVTEKKGDDKTSSEATSGSKKAGSKPKADAKGKKAPPKKSAASPQKGKQTSLMSFFKKK